MRSNLIKKIDKKLGITIAICIFLMTLVTVALSSFVRINNTTQYMYYYSKLKPGYIADEDVRVSKTIDIIDTEATVAAKEKARDAVLPIFVYSYEKSMQSNSNLEKVLIAVNKHDLEGLNNLVGEDIASDILNLKDRRVYTIAGEIISDVLNRGYYEYSNIAELAKEGYTSLFFVQDDIYDIKNLSSVLTSANISGFVYKDAAKYSSILSMEEIQSMCKMLEIILQPNIIYNTQMTKANRENAYNNTENKIISLTKGDYIIQKDKVITQDSINLLKQLAESHDISIKDVLRDSAFAVIFYTVLSMLFANSMIFSDVYKRHYVQYFALLTFFMICNACATYAFLQYTEYLNIDFIDIYLPAIFLPSIMTMITSHKRFGLITAGFNAIMMVTLPGSTWLTFFYIFAVGGVSTYLIKLMNKRLDSFLQYITTLLSVAALTCAFVSIGDYSLTLLLKDLLIVAIRVTASIIIELFMLPIIERIFNLPTIFRLHELAYSDNVLLKRLYQSAPGTYNHSKQVAELAEAAADEIGANGLLARVGGLYHDIGKTDHPEYFTENQTGENKHDEINPSLSATIIKNHVKLGYEKGRTAHLPEEVNNIIFSHHGNDVIYYFYHEAKENISENEGEVRKEDFSYNADLPDSREAGVVMLADGVEAASRTITEPNPAKFAKLIRQIVYGKIERNQLDKSHLTMGQIKTVEASFLKTLLAQYHSRIEYPDEDEKK